MLHFEKCLAFMLLIGTHFVKADFDPEELDSRSSVTYEFSFLLPGNARDCFYQHITSGSKLKFSYEVSLNFQYIKLN